MTLRWSTVSATDDGTLVTVFMGDRRVTTNVRKADGSRVIGTTLAAGPVYDRVLKEGKTYRGDANIFDTPHFAIYEPILSEGAVIGILFVGTPRLAVTKQAAQLSAARRSDEIGEMQDAVLALGKAAKAKEIAEREAAEQRQEARDSQRRFQASQRDAQRRIDEERERTAQAQARIAEERAAEQAKMAEERETSAQSQARLTEERAAEQARMAQERAAEQAKAAAEQTRVVDTLAHGLARLSEGDLTVRLHEGFTEASRQIRDDFNATAERLRETIGANRRGDTRGRQRVERDFGQHGRPGATHGKAGGKPRADFGRHGRNLHHCKARTRKTRSTPADPPAALPRSPSGAARWWRGRSRP